ncbi:DUF1178 family protein, partial [Thioclava sp. BHET1]
MIRYALKCNNDHSFESWFASAEAYETLARQGHVSCAICGSTEVTKSLMAPAVQAGRKKAALPPESTAAPPSESAPPAARPLAPASPMEQALQALRRQIEENSDYVGMNFAKEARAIHEGREPERAIYGEAKLEDARALLEDGIAGT